MEPFGFVVRYVPSVSPQERCRIWCRPWPTTPEAVRETQPVVDERIVLVYRGRVDNRAEVAHLLAAPDLARAADGRVLAAACAAWGAGLAQHVLGEYAFAALDRRSGALTAGCDALGLVRLVWRHDGRALWIASGVDVLWEAIPEKPSLDPAAVARHLAGRGQLRGPETVWRGVRDLRQGHALVHDGAAPREVRSWAPVDRPIGPRDESEAAEVVRDHLYSAVRAALRAHGGVWTDLSGGLDSSTVSCTAAALRDAGEGPDGTLCAFSTISPRTPQSDERDYQRIVRAAAGLDAVELDLDPLPDYGALDDYRWEPTFATFRGALERRVHELAAATGTRVDLTGIGGDQVFCFGDFPPLLLADVLRRRPWVWPREVRAWLRQGRRSLWNLVWHCSLRAPTNSLARPVALPRPTWAWDGLVAAARELERAAWQDGERTFASPATELQFRMIARVGSVLHTRSRPPLEYRHPLLQRPLVELSLSLPWDLKLRPGRDRVLQRRALRGIVPDAILDRVDKTASTAARFRGLRESWRHVVPYTAGQRLADLGLVDPQRFRAACERMRHGLRENDWLFLATALDTEGWLSLLAQPAPRSAVWDALRATFAADREETTPCTTAPLSLLTTATS